MKKLVTLGLAALLLAASVGFGGYAMSVRSDEPPECCKTKEACCPGSSCCPKGQHSDHCRLRV